MAFDPLSVSTRYTRRTLVVASLASLAISLNVAEFNEVTAGFVSLNKPNYLEYIILVVMFWTAFAFAFAARVDHQNSERTSLERRYVKSWEEFHSVVEEPVTGYIQDETAEDTYSNELFKFDFNKLKNMDQNDRSFVASIEKLEGSRNFLLEKMPKRDRYTDQYAPVEAALKFWIVDIIMPYVLFSYAIYEYFSM